MIDHIVDHHGHRDTGRSTASGNPSQTQCQKKSPRRHYDFGYALLPDPFDYAAPCERIERINRVFSFDFLWPSCPGFAVLSTRLTMTPGRSDSALVNSVVCFATPLLKGATGPTTAIIFSLGDVTSQS
jgi:hypothetical protein